MSFIPPPMRSKSYDACPCFFIIMRHLIPYSKAANVSLTHLYTTLTFIYINRQSRYKYVSVRLACVKHLNSIQSEPSSNSIFFSCTGRLQLISLIWHLTSYFHTTLSTLCFITPSSSLEVNLSRDTCGPQAPRAEPR